MVTVPSGQIVLMVYGWIAMWIYLYLVYEILRWRRKITQFQSSYYTLFLLQAVADFYVFFFLEFVMRPRKFDYFNAFSVDMQTYAAFSYCNLMIAEVILCCGHIIIALNRFTSFYYPFILEKVGLARKIQLYLSASFEKFLFRLIQGFSSLINKPVSYLFP